MQEEHIVKHIMRANPEMIPSTASLTEAAIKMKALDCGVLPVGTDSQLEGIITDRDIVIRAIAAGKDPSEERVMDYMTPRVVCCNEDDTLAQAADRMGDNHISRLVVQNDSGKVCGILTFGRILRQDDNVDEIAEVIECAVGSKAA